MSLSVKRSFISNISIVTIAYHSLISRKVNVTCQFCINSIVNRVYVSSKPIELYGIGNLIGIIHRSHVVGLNAIAIGTQTINVLVGIRVNSRMV